MDKTNDKKKVLSNTVWVVIVRVVQAFLNVIITMLTARLLGPSNFGSLQYAMAVVAFVTPLMHLGFTSIAVQELVNEPKKEGEILGTSISSSFVSSIFCIVGVIAFTLIANAGERETIIVCMLYSMVLLIGSFDVLTYWFQSKLMSKYVSLVSLFAFFITSLFKAYLLITGKSIYWFAISNVIDYSIIAVLSLVLYKKMGGQKMIFSKETFFRMIDKSKYYIISELMIVIFAQTDRIMLKLMIDESATGLYSAAVSCAGMASFVFAAIIDSFRPVIFESKKNNEDSFNRNMCRLYSIVIYLAICQCIVIFLFSKYIILILYGSEYLPAIRALKIISWYTLFGYLGSIKNIWILANNQQRIIWKIDISGAIANVVMNVLLIPSFGITGAAFASLITQIFTNVIVVGILKEVRPNIKLMVNSLSPRWMIEMLRIFKKVIA